MNPEEILISTLSNIGYDIMKYIGKDLYNKIISYLEGNTNKRQIKNTAQILKYYADERQKYQSGYNEEKEEIDDDWFAYWHERSKLVSDKDLQGVWAKILNTELNSQGSVSKKTLEYLSIAEKLELEMFSNLSQFEVCISGNTYQPIILDHLFDSNFKHLERTPENASAVHAHRRPDIYNGIDLEYLEDIGLIKINRTETEKINQIKQVSYFSKPIAIKELTNKQTLWLGSITYSKIGAELAESIRNNNSPIKGFMEFLMEKWKHFIDYSRMKAPKT